MKQSPVQVNSSTANQSPNTKAPVTCGFSTLLKGISNNCKVTSFNIMDGELLGGYYDRVIDETW